MQNYLSRNSRTILLKEVGYEGSLSISASKILLIGAGGLSSSIISILVSSGVGELILWEPDVLELSNLQRQFIYKSSDVSNQKAFLAQGFARELNPDVKFTALPKKLCDETFQEFLEYVAMVDAVIDGTDSFSSRVLANKACVGLKKPFFTGSCIGFGGQVYSFFPSLQDFDQQASLQAEFPCYSCLFGEDYKEFQEQQTCENAGIFPPIPSIVGSLMAQNVLSFIALKKMDFSKFILVDFLQEMYFKEIKIKKDLNCKICSIK